MISVGIVIGIVFSEAAKRNASTPGRQSTAGHPVQMERSATTDPVATLEKFDAIKDGMTYERVREIMGSPGKVESSDHFSGFSDGTGAMDSALYKWEGKNLSFAYVSFRNNAVTSKSQYGLK